MRQGVNYLVINCDCTDTTWHSFGPINVINITMEYNLVFVLLYKNIHLSCNYNKIEYDGLRFLSLSVSVNAHSQAYTREFYVFFTTSVVNLRGH